jgi:hypothetical protein
MIITHPETKQNELIALCDSYCVTSMDGDNITAEVQGNESAITRWAVENGYMIPQSVRLGHLLVALLDYDESIYDAIMQLQQSDKRVAAAMRDPTVNRNSETLLGVQQAFQMPDAVIDQLFVNAYMMRL